MSKETLKWKIESQKARKLAKTRKIDQGTIDRVIEQKRYQKLAHRPQSGPRS